MENSPANPRRFTMNPRPQQLRGGVLHLRLAPRPGEKCAAFWQWENQFFFATDLVQGAPVPEMAIDMG